MVEFRWIIFSLFLMLVFPAANGDYSPFTVRVGDEVTLPCENMINDQDKCENTTWQFSDSRHVVTLIERGQIHKDAKAKSDRLSVTEKCFLVVKKVTAEDGGSYICKQFKSRQRQDASVYLSVIIMTEHEDNNETTLNCSVDGGWCAHTVRWLYESKDVDEDVYDNNNDDGDDIETSQSKCSAAVTFLTSYRELKSNYHELFKCEVTDIYNKKVQLFPFSLQSSGDDATSAAPKSLTTIKSTGNKSTSVETGTSEGENQTTSTNNNNGTKHEGWWWFIVVSVGVAALLITIVAVIIWKKTKGNKTQMNENLADPEDGVSYTSISYTRKTNSKAKAQGDGDDNEGDRVTYSTVKASSSSAGASTDPNNLYATVNKPNK